MDAVEQLDEARDIMLEENNAEHNISIDEENVPTITGLIVNGESLVENKNMVSANPIIAKNIPKIHQSPRFFEFFGNKASISSQ